jgi:3'-5' exoribonuclease
LKVAPAAKTLHHAFVGGLLEHVTSLLRLARLTASNYDFVDLDLVTTGVVLHDLGKIDELHYKRSFGYTDEGQLLGHMVIVLRMVDRKCAEMPDFPPRLKTLVEHLILSHHGHYEYGSPKLPMFPEALLLHYIDDLDSKLESMRAGLAKMIPEATWSRFNPALDRTVLRKESYLAEQPAETPVATPAEPPALPTQAPLLESVADPKTTGGNFADKLRSALDD